MLFFSTGAIDARYFCDIYIKGQVEYGREWEYGRMRWVWLIGSGLPIDNNTYLRIFIVLYRIVRIYALCIWHMVYTICEHQLFDVIKYV